MKSQLIAIVAAVLVVGCGESQQSAPAPEVKPEPPTAKAPDISIHDAVREGNIEAIKQHIAAGVDVNAKANDGWTPLHGAARWKHKEIIELLIAAGADVNAKEEGGVTSLLYAAMDGHKEIAELLITAGADVNAKLVSDGPHKGKTPLNAANEANHPEVAALLRKHGGKTGEELKAEGK
jgi:ankyrin repeat protein